MEWIFYLVSAIAVLSALLVVTRLNPVHALLYLVVCLLAFAILFWMLGAAFAALLQVIVYAGAILVLVVFVIMMLNQGADTVAQEKAWLKSSNWVGPALLTSLLLCLLLWLIHQSSPAQPLSLAQVVSAKQVGISLFGPYLIAVELASFLLLAGLVGAFHISRGLGQRHTEVQDD